MLPFHDSTFFFKYKRVIKCLKIKLTYIAQPVDLELANECEKLDQQVDNLSKRIEEYRRSSIADIVKQMDFLERHEQSIAAKRNSRTPMPLLSKAETVPIEQARKLVKHCQDRVNQLSVHLPSSLDRAELTIAAVREIKRLPETDIDRAVKSTATESHPKPDFPQLEISKRIFQSLDQQQRKRQATAKDE